MPHGSVALQSSAQKTKRSLTMGQYMQYVASKKIHAVRSWSIPKSCYLTENSFHALGFVGVPFLDVLCSRACCFPRILARMVEWYKIPLSLTPLTIACAKILCSPLNDKKISYLTPEIMQFFYLTPKLKFFPMCPPLEFFFPIWHFRKFREQAPLVVQVRQGKKP
jgi:hypothetical protein